MNSTETPKPCPYCSEVSRLTVSNGKGNRRNEHLRSGLPFKIQHTKVVNEDCLIASREGVMQAWNL